MGRRHVCRFCSDSGVGRAHSTTVHLASSRIQRSHSAGRTASPTRPTRFPLQRPEVWLNGCGFPQLRHAVARTRLVLCVIPKQPMRIPPCGYNARFSPPLIVAILKLTRHRPVGRMVCRTHMTRLFRPHCSDSCHPSSELRGRRWRRHAQNTGGVGVLRPAAPLSKTICGQRLVMSGPARAPCS
ncbi:hypothetical protein DAEQUDRAFT_463651 [Daedalea quercina L-15889]|uniref:Uncharacterized protein n=1 Tax=Daedalea quercina L-15889 TaxID=1314783 RepID=A0A165TED2_9APHY|nr:hypothetical protein DAEQUDRAFT_463651 [Daedalea quercina L-15889]